MLLFTLLIAIKPHLWKRPVVGNCIKCPQNVHGGLLVIPKSVLIECVFEINFIIFVRLNNKIYIFCYFILNCDDNRTFGLYVSYLSFIIIFLSNFESVICCRFCHNFLKQSKNCMHSPYITR